MKIVEVRDLANEMLSNFVDKLGLDGKAYVESTKCPMIFGDLGFPGKFYTARGKELKNFLQTAKLPQDQKDFIFEEGLIVIDNDYKDMPADEDLLVTCIHEKLHANRMLLAHSPKKFGEDIDPILYDGDKFVKTTSEFEDQYVDPVQDIYLGTFDDSKGTVSKYDDLNYDERDELSFADETTGGKMLFQQKQDEALVDLMATVAYQLSTGNFDNIMDVVKDISIKNILDDDIVSMANIIVRHNDLELFKWMIDPLTYQNGDIYYDYFAHYVNEEDKEDIDIITHSEAIMPNDRAMDNVVTDFNQAKMR